jgi:hypothetical protein
MYAKEIHNFTTADPFRPFRVYLSDGGTVDVTDEVGRLLTGQALILGVEPDADGMPSRSIHLDVDHITRLGTLDDPARRSSTR